MSPLILLLFTTEYCNIMMNSTCSVVYLSPLHTSFMQVFLASRHCYQFSWTGHQRVKRNSFTRKGKVLIHFQAWKRSESLSSSFYQRTEYFFLERNSTISENTPSKNEILKKKSLSENTLSESTLLENTLSQYALSKSTLSKNTLSETTLLENTLSENTLLENTIS